MGLASLLSEVRMNLVALYKSGIGAASHTIQAFIFLTIFAVQAKMQHVLQTREALLLGWVLGVGNLQAD